MLYYYVKGIDNSMIKQKTERTRMSRKKVVLIGIVVFAALLFDLTVGGYLKFGYYVAKCGGVPVAAGPAGFGMGEWSYWLPGNYSPGGMNAVYRCSEADMIKAGYRKNPLQ